MMINQVPYYKLVLLLSFVLDNGLSLNLRSFIWCFLVEKCGQKVFQKGRSLYIAEVIYSHYLINYQLMILMSRWCICFMPTYCLFVNTETSCTTHIMSIVVCKCNKKERYVPKWHAILLSEQIVALLSQVQLSDIVGVCLTQQNESLVFIS